MLERQRDDIHDFLSSQEPESLLDSYADSYRVPRDVMRRVMKRESGGDQGAVSRKGARGRMQLMPATARGLGVNPDDPVGNVEGGVRYFREQLDAFGDTEKALAAYNAGPGAVRKYGGVPPYRETQDYVRAITGGGQEDDDIAEFLKRSGSGRDAQPTDGTPDDVAGYLSGKQGQSSNATARRYGLTPEEGMHFDLSGGARKPAAWPVAARPEVERFESAAEVETAAERTARLLRRPPLAFTLAPTAATAAPDDTPTGRPKPSPDAAAVQTFKVRIPRAEVARAETPEQREGLLVSAYVNTLPAEDHGAALAVLENLRSRTGGRLLDRVPDSFAATDSGEHVVQGVGVDVALPELIHAYKQGGPQALNQAIDELGARRAKHAEGERQKLAEREALARAIKREGEEAGQDGQLHASGNILLNQTEQGFRKLGGNLAGVAGALAGRLGLDSVDHSLTDTYENQASAARALDESSRRAEERSGLHPVAAEAAKGVGMLPEMVGTLALGGPTGLALGEMVKGADEPMLETMMRSYAQAAFGAGAEAQATQNYIKRVIGGAGMQALQSSPEVAEWAALESAAPGSINPERLKQARERARRAMASVVAGGLTGAVMEARPGAKADAGVIAGADAPAALPDALAGLPGVAALDEANPALPPGHRLAVFDVGGQPRTFAYDPQAVTPEQIQERLTTPATAQGGSQQRSGLPVLPLDTEAVRAAEARREMAAQGLAHLEQEAAGVQENGVYIIPPKFIPTGEVDAARANVTQADAELAALSRQAHSATPAGADATPPQPPRPTADVSPKLLDAFRAMGEEDLRRALVADGWDAGEVGKLNREELINHAVETVTRGARGLSEEASVSDFEQGLRGQVFGGRKTLSPDEQAAARSEAAAKLGVGDEREAVALASLARISEMQRADLLPDEWHDLAGEAWGRLKDAELSAEAVGALRAAEDSSLTAGRADDALKAWAKKYPDMPERLFGDSDPERVAESLRRKWRGRKYSPEAGFVDTQILLDLADFALFGAQKIRAGAGTLAEFAREMVREFGEWVRPHARRLYLAAREFLSNERGEASADLSPVEQTMRRVLARRKLRRAAEAELAALPEERLRALAGDLGVELPAKAASTSDVDARAALARQLVTLSSAMRKLNALTVAEARKVAEESGRFWEGERAKGARRAAAREHTSGLTLAEWQTLHDAIPTESLQRGASAKLSFAEQSVRLDPQTLKEQMEKLLGPQRAARLIRRLREGQSSEESRQPEAPVTFERFARAAEKEIAEAGLSASDVWQAATGGGVSDAMQSRLARLKGAGERAAFKPTEAGFIRFGGQRRLVPLPKDFKLQDWYSEASAAINSHPGLKPAQLKKALGLLAAGSKAASLQDGAVFVRARRELSDLLARSKPVTAGDVVGALAGLPRALMATGEMSFTLLQGGLYSLGHPMKSLEALGNSLRSISSMGYDEITAALQSHPRAELARKAGLYQATRERLKAEAELTDREETFMSRFAERLPVVKQSGQMMEAFLDTQRLLVFDAYAKALEQSGLTPDKNPGDFTQAARFVNYATGRGSLGQRLEKAAGLLGATGFSPRFVASRFNVLNPAMYARMNPTLRRQALKDMFTALGAMTAGLALAHAGGAEVEFDPDSPDFLKAKWGDYRLSVSAGLLPQIRLAAKLAKHFTDINPRDPMPGLGRMVGDIAHWGRGKLAPIPSFLADAYFGRDYTGRPVTAKEAAVSRVAPIFWKSAFDAWREAGGEGLLKQSPEFFGAQAGQYRSRRAVVSLAADSALAFEFARLKQGGALVLRMEGEPEEVYHERQGRISEWYNTHGEALVADPLYLDAADEVKERALGLLVSRSVEQSKKAAPQEDLLSPRSLLRAAEQGVRAGRGRDERRRQSDLYVPPKRERRSFAPSP